MPIAGIAMIKEAKKHLSIAAFLFSLCGNGLCCLFISGLDPVRDARNEGRLPIRTTEAVICLFLAINARLSYSTRHHSDFRSTCKTIDSWENISEDG
jgi:hypothetical protein